MQVDRQEVETGGHVPTQEKHEMQGQERRGVKMV